MESDRCIRYPLQMSRVLFQVKLKVNRLPSLKLREGIDSSLQALTITKSCWGIVNCFGNYQAILFQRFQIVIWFHSIILSSTVTLGSMMQVSSQLASYSYLVTYAAILEHLATSLFFVICLAGIWVVYLISEGVGLRLNFTGLHVVTIQTTNSTFNIYTYEGKHLLAWEHRCIRRTGRVGPVVFLEGGRKCRGGPGVLWMYHPEHLAAKFKNELERLVIYSFTIQFRGVARTT